MKMPSYSLNEKVQNFAIFTRFGVLVLQAVANLIIPDHNADAFVSPPNPNLPELWGDKVVEVLLGGLMRWDAQYFIHIAEYGYTHENTLAFFPAFPIAVRFTAWLLSFVLQFVCNHHSILLVSAVLLNFIFFVKAADALFKLSRKVLKDDILAYRAALLFCINPASIFFSAPYSEAMYAFFTFYALLLNETRNATVTSLPFAVASAARSNGLVNIGFILYHKLQDCSNYYYKIRNATTESGHLSLLIVVILTFNYTLIPLFISCAFVILPFVFFQFWSYYTYCNEDINFMQEMPPHIEMFVRSNFLHSPDIGSADWCYNVPPLAYSFVQNKYWEVGLLRYYEVRQVPNFLVAIPVVMLVIVQAALYLVDNPHVCWSLGIKLPDSEVRSKKDKTAFIWHEEGINSWRLFVYTAHALCLCAFCVLCIHVQVTTRLLCSSCPILYWFAAHLYSGSNAGQQAPKGASPELRSETAGNLRSCWKVSVLTDFPKPFWGQVIITYFFLYFFVGTIMFSNFLPWT
ncbi:phosphatidylinositol glycan anchor biosynthesis class V isoform X4 [Oratosquilla oratoria]|uniref:phosphatidylinositol glycan anchor biosynthesis class V isoform X4 n=1 Tax=Oratosquilla oratoria TaxID=337810 RepID=UPI003F7607FC